MIIDFRVTVPLNEYMERLPTEESIMRESTRSDGGYARVYKEKMVEDYRLSLDAMLKSMETGGVEKAVLQAEYNGSDDYRKINEAAIRITEKYPDKFPACFMCLNPQTNDDMVKVVERGAKDHGFRGINLQAWAVRVSTTDSRFWPVYDLCQKMDLIVTIHSSISFNVDRSLYYSHVSHLDKIACDFPNLKLVANHGGWPWVLEMIAIAWKHPNVYIELGGVSPKYFGTPGSGWEPLMQYGNSLLQNQVLFATDCMLPHKRCVDEVKDLSLKEEVKRKWLGENAARLLQLDK